MSPAASKPKSSTLAPERPSGVSWGRSSASMPASTLHPMTEVANPVMHWAAVRAQAGEFAVINTRAARISKASANVSTTRTPRRTMPPPGLAPLSPVMPLPTSRSESLLCQRPSVLRVQPARPLILPRSGGVWVVAAAARSRKRPCSLLYDALSVAVGSIMRSATATRERPDPV